MSVEHENDNIDMYVSSKIKQSWKRAYENGVFDEDFPPYLQVNTVASQTTYSSTEFVERIPNRVRSKPNAQKPVDATVQETSATQPVLEPLQMFQSIPKNNNACQSHLMAKFQPGIVARSMNQSTSDINGLQIGSSTHSLMSTMNTQRPIDPRLRRYWQPVSTQNLHHETLCQPKQTRITDNSLEHRISIADYYKRYALDPSEQGKDSKVRKNQQTLARSIPKDGQNAIAVYDVPIDRSNTPDKDQEIEQNQVTSQNDRGKENEPELSFYPNFETPTRTQETKAATDSPISNEYEEMVNVAEDEITIKDEVAVMPTDAIQVIGEFDFDDSDDTEIYDFEIFNEERKIDISAVLKGPAIIDMAEVNLSPNNEVDLEEKKEELQSFKIKTELEEVEDSDNQNDLDDLLVPVSTQFDFNQTVRIILDRIDQSQPMENLDFLQKKKEPLKPLLESELEAEPEPEPKPEPEPEPDLKLTVQKADQLLSDIEITTSDDDIIYVLSSDYDSDVEMQNQ